MIRATIASDYELLLAHDDVPARGLALMGCLVYEDGQLLGCLKARMPWHPAIEHVLDLRGEWVRVFYEPLSEALTKEPA